MSVELAPGIAIDFAMFDAAADFTTSEVVEYRRFIFPLLLGDSTHVPFFSVEDAPGWMTARGSALYQGVNLAEHLDPLRDHRYASLRQLRAYREQVVGEAYVNHPFFQVDRAEDWVAPAPFNTWMWLMQELEVERGRKFVRCCQHSSLSHHLGASKLSLQLRHLIAFDELSQEREEGQEEWTFLLSWQKAIQGELQEQLKVDRRREDLKTEVKVLRLEIDAEKQNRRDWVSRRSEIDAKLRELRTEPLKGVQIQGRHTPIDFNSDAPIPASIDNSNDTTISDATGNSRSDEPTSKMTLYLTDTDTQMESHPGFELDPELEPNHECESTFIWSPSTLHSPVSLVYNDNTLRTDDTDSGFGLNFGLASTTPTHSDSDLLQMITASATLPSVSVPGPAVLALATTPAARRHRRQSVDENDIVEGSRQRTQSKRARGEA
ncbi:hypothetical protein B0H14DRAFT_3449787 [Mycena olivaceomarginata]|nr:hypothetical protein B0H14DRAFT_3449787 [Mycena olivaceomarginata]